MTSSQNTWRSKNRNQHLTRSLNARQTSQSLASGDTSARLWREEYLDRMLRKDPEMLDLLLGLLFGYDP